jgi:hypothetical protein
MRGRTPALTRAHGRLTVPLSDSAPLSAAKQANKQANKQTNIPAGGGRLTPLPLEAALAMALVSPYPREIEDLYKLEACVLPPAGTHRCAAAARASAVAGRPWPTPGFGGGAETRRPGRREGGREGGLRPNR